VAHAAAAGGCRRRRQMFPNRSLSPWAAASGRTLCQPDGQPKSR
jgi:hypothetical protein